MQQLTRSWPGLAASGAALLYAAVGAGLVVSAPTPLPLAIGILLIALAVLNGVWSVAAFRAGIVIRPRSSLWLFLAPLMIWAIALFSPSGAHTSHEEGSATAVDSATVATVPMASAALLSIALAIACGVRMRRPQPRPRHAPAASGARFMIGLVIGSCAVSGLVTPALAASDAGELAVPHGTHSAP